MHTGDLYYSLKFSQSCKLNKYGSHGDGHGTVIPLLDLRGINIERFETFFGNIKILEEHEDRNQEVDSTSAFILSSPGKT